MDLDRSQLILFIATIKTTWIGPKKVYDTSKDNRIGTNKGCRLGRGKLFYDRIHTNLLGRVWMRKRRKTVRRVTADKKVKINRLASLLYDFLPLSSRSNYAVTFQSIFTESGIRHYPGDSGSKQKALEKGFTFVYRYHERLPQKLIRKIVSAAVGYRRYMRRPLTRKELDQLSAVLFDLDIDMRKELADIELDEILPRIIVPPKDLEERLRKHNLDPAISGDPLELFSDGHFNEAVRKAGEIFEDRVRQSSGLESFGRGLMGKAFNNGSLIDFSSIEPENRKDFISGYRFLCMGAMAAIRNIFSHGDEKPREPEECFETLLFFNWLFRFLK